MPTISMFYGIIIRLYFAPGEHNPPHFHAFYNEFKASVVSGRERSLRVPFHHANADLWRLGWNCIRKN